MHTEMFIYLYICIYTFRECFCHAKYARACQARIARCIQRGRQLIVSLVFMHSIVKRDKDDEAAPPHFLFSAGPYSRS